VDRDRPESHAPPIPVVIFPQPALLAYVVDTFRPDAILRPWLYDPPILTVDAATRRRYNDGKEAGQLSLTFLRHFPSPPCHAT